MKQIRINAPGAGERIVELSGGHNFDYGVDHSISTWDGDTFLGGFVFNQYVGNAIAVHDGADHPHWCSRDLLWTIFHYAFKQLHCGVLVAPTPSNNHTALALNLRAGFKLETLVRDLIRPGVHLMVLTMRETDCRWLRIIPTTVVNNDRGVEGYDHGWR